MHIKQKQKIHWLKHNGFKRKINFDFVTFLFELLDQVKFVESNTKQNGI